MRHFGRIAVLVALIAVGCSGGADKASTTAKIGATASTSTLASASGPPSASDTAQQSITNDLASFPDLCSLTPLSDVQAALGSDYQMVAPNGGACAVAGTAARLEWQVEPVDLAGLTPSIGGYAPSDKPKTITQIPGHSALAFTGPNASGGFYDASDGPSESLESDLAVGVGGVTLVIDGAGPSLHLDDQLALDIQVANVLLQHCAQQKVSGC